MVLASRQHTLTELNSRISLAQKSITAGFACPLDPSIIQELTHKEESHLHSEPDTKNVNSRRSQGEDNRISTY